MLKEAIEEASEERDEFSFVLVSNGGRLEYTGNLESGLRLIKLMNYKEDPKPETVAKEKVNEDKPEREHSTPKTKNSFEIQFKEDVVSGMTLKQLAAKYDKTEQTISNWKAKFNLVQKKTPKMN
jgi:hypothetical protein